MARERLRREAGGGEGPDHGAKADWVLFFFSAADKYHFTGKRVV